MAPHSVPKKTCYTAITIAFIALIGLTLFQHRQIRQLRAMIPELSQKQTTSSPNAPAGTPPPQRAATAQSIAGRAAPSSMGEVQGGQEDDVDNLQYQLQAAEEELDMVHEDLNREMDRKAELARQKREIQRQQFQDATFKKYIRENLNDQVADFIEAFNISPEDAEAFVALLLEQQMAQQELYLDAQEISAPTDEDRKSFMERSKETMETFEAKSSELLGDAVFDEYAAYQQRYYIKEYTVSTFKETLDAGDQITDDQEEALVTAVYEAQQDYIEEMREKAAAEETERTYTFPSDTAAEDNLDRIIENMTRRNETYLNAADGILTASQIQGLETYLQNELDQQIMYQKMSTLESGY